MQFFTVVDTSVTEEAVDRNDTEEDVPNETEGMTAAARPGDEHARAEVTSPSSQGFQSQTATVTDRRPAPEWEDFEWVPDSIVKVAEITGHFGISFTSDPFERGNAIWNTCMLNYTDSSGDVVHGMVDLPVVIECRSDESYALFKSNVTGKGAQFVSAHIPRPSYSALFKPAFEFDNFKAPVHVSRLLGDTVGASVEHYCVVNTRVDVDLATEEGDNGETTPVKEVVDMFAARGKDLLMNATVKCKVSTRDDNGMVYAKCIILKASIVGEVRKACTEEDTASPRVEFDFARIGEVPEFSDIMRMIGNVRQTVAA
jgi:hypothetical protein